MLTAGAALALLLAQGCRTAPKAPAPEATTQQPATQPMPHAHIYPEVDAAKTDIAAALTKAKREHKRVLVDFGGDWCGDCQVLNLYFHQPDNRPHRPEHRPGHQIRREFEEGRSGAGGARPERQLGVRAKRAVFQHAPYGVGLGA